MLPRARPVLPGPSGSLRIGLMGGSFDPPHSGHVHVAETARKALGLDWIWILPAAGNPLKTTQTPFAERLANARRMLSGPRSLVSSLEADLGVRYTIDLVNALQARAPGARFVWIIGADNLAGFHRWKRWKDIARRLPICVVSRPGAHPRAGLSRFARTFASARRLPQEAGTLARTHAPAWIVLTAPFDPASSTALRTAANQR